MFIHLDCKDVPNIDKMLHKNLITHHDFYIPRKDKTRKAYCYFQDFNSKLLPSKFKLFVVPENTPIFYNTNVNDYFEDVNNFSHYSNDNIKDYYVNYYTARFMIRVLRDIIYGKSYDLPTKLDLNKKQIWNIVIGPFDLKFAYVVSILNKLNISGELINVNIIDNNNNNIAWSLKLHSNEPETLTQFLQKIYLTIISVCTPYKFIKHYENNTIEKFVNLCYNWIELDSKGCFLLSHNLFMDDLNQINKFKSMIKRKQQKQKELL